MQEVWINVWITLTNIEEFSEKKNISIIIVNNFLTLTLV